MASNKSFCVVCAASLRSPRSKSKLKLKEVGESEQIKNLFYIFDLLDLDLSSDSYNLQLNGLPLSCPPCQLIITKGATLSSQIKQMQIDLTQVKSKLKDKVKNSQSAADKSFSIFSTIRRNFLKSSSKIDDKVYNKLNSVKKEQEESNNNNEDDDDEDSDTSTKYEFEPEDNSNILFDNNEDNYEEKFEEFIVEDDEEFESYFLNQPEKDDPNEFEKPPPESEPTENENENENQKSFSVSDQSPKRRNRKPLQKIHQCMHCEMSFSRKYVFVQHVATHLGVTPFKCPDCNKGFTGKMNLHSHRSRVHPETARHRCNDCNKGFPVPCLLKEHMKKVHNVDYIPPPPPPRAKQDQTSNSNKKEGLLICELCAKTFLFMNNLKQHLRMVHFKERKHPCDFPDCDYIGITPSGLNAHKANHSSLLNSICDECGKGYKSAKYLKEHKLTHTPKDERKYKCPDCPKRFYKNSKMEEHRKHHSNIRPFRCTKCPKGFVNARILKLHHATVHKEGKTYLRRRKRGVQIEEEEEEEEIEEQVEIVVDIRDLDPDAIVTDDVKDVIVI